MAPESLQVSTEETCEHHADEPGAGDDDVRVIGQGVLREDESLLHKAERGLQNFTEMNLPGRLTQELRQAGFSAPTPIQRHALPVALAGHDLIGLARTGSGKTLAFLLPAFARLLLLGGQAAVQGIPFVQVLVLTPTRELTDQIEEMARRFGSSSGIRVLALHGGVPYGPQLQALRQLRPQLLVASPGRLLDLVNHGQVDICKVQILVVDEADRLLDMGFMPQVREVLEHLPARRQNLLFTATWPQEVHELAEAILRPDHVEVQIGRCRELAASADVEQTVLVLPDRNAKELALLNLIQSFFCKTEAGKESALIFCTSRGSCDELHGMLQRSGVDRCAVVHARYDQRAREQTMEDFRQGAVRILVATDLVARGLDIPSVSLVINFEPPHSFQSEDYIHRIGRTGRAGHRGRAVTYLTPREANQAKAILEVLRRAGREPSQDLIELAARAQGTARERKLQQRACHARRQQELRQRTTFSSGFTLQGLLLDLQLLFARVRARLIARLCPRTRRP